MSSPHKFRVWDGEEMHEPPHEYIWDPREGARRVIGASDGRLTCGQPVDGEVLWGTGLTDAEGTTIYQGDLLRRPSKWDPESDKRVLVYFEPPSFVDEYGYEIQETRHIDGDIIVLGNRYENPELLEEPTS